MLDLAILFGTSPTANSKERFAAQKKLVKDILKKYDLSKEKTLVSFIMNEKPPVSIMKLGDITDKTMAVRLIDSIVDHKKNIDLGNALAFIREKVFSPDQGARPNVPKSVLIFIDSKNIGDLREASEVSKKLKDEGIKLIIIGQGNDINKNGLVPLAYNGSTIFFPPDMEEIEKLVRPVSDAIKPGEWIFARFHHDEYHCSMLYFVEVCDV